MFLNEALKMKVRQKSKNNGKERLREIIHALGDTAVSKGFVVGIFAGLTVALYRLCLSLASNFVFPLYERLSKSPFLIIAAFAVLGLFGYIVGLFIKSDPMIAGSGINQVNGVLIEKVKLKPLKVIMLKFIGGIISLGAGLSLGRAGPSIQIGAAAGLAVSSRESISKQKMLLSYGVAAGLAATFNTPLAGICFVMEELNKSVSKHLLTGAAVASLTADFISKLFFGTAPIFKIEHKPNLPLNQYYYLIILGIVLGVAGVIFNKALLKSEAYYDKIFKLPVEFKPVIPFMFAGVIGFTFPLLLGGGYDIAEHIMQHNTALGFLAAALIIKFVFTMISYISSAPGGLFFPILSIGALTGCLTAVILVRYFGLDSEFIPVFVILAMAGYFTAVVKSPITGMVLVSEMTGGFGGFLMFCVVCMVSYIVSDILKGLPVFEMLLKNYIKKNFN